MSTDKIDMCANCGKGEDDSDILKSCAACKLVKYCNRECQIAHRPLHKKACKKRAAELHDEALFKEPPPPQECPICFLPMPGFVQQRFRPCCGKLICAGCTRTMVIGMPERGEVDLCPFCRKPPPCSTKAEYEKMMKDGTTGLFRTLHEKEDIKRTKNLVESGSTNADAYYSLGAHYDHGSSGLPQDYEKANELYLRAGELGCAEAYYNLGISYENGEGVEVDMKKAEHYWELAAMKGNVQARYNLACLEGEAGNKHRAWKHFLLAARAGDKDSLDRVKDGFKWNLVTKDEYADALRAYQNIRDESKSDDRNAHEEFLSGGLSEE